MMAALECYMKGRFDIFFLGLIVGTLLGWFIPLLLLPGHRVCRTDERKLGRSLKQVLEEYIQERDRRSKE